MKERHKVKCNITKSLYNFTDLEVDPKLLEQIENGVMNVPIIKKDGVSVVEHSLREILSNLEVYRRYQQRSSPINQRNVRNWLQEAIAEVEDDAQDEHTSYYKSIQDNLGKAMRLIK